MRLVASILALALVLPLGAQDKKKSDWVKISSDDGKFDVMFPQKPTTTENKGATQYILEADGGKSVYLAMANAFPKAVDPNDKDFAKNVFAGAISGVEKSLKGEKLSEKESKFGKYPARDVDYKVEGLGIYRTKWILTESAFIQLVVAGEKEFVDGVNAKKFMGSLKLKD